MDKETKKELDGLRKGIRQFLDDLVEGDGFSPRLISMHTGIGYRRLYRWLSNDMMLPPLKECRALMSLVKRVERVKGDYASIVASWNPERYCEITRLGLFSYPYLKTLENETLSPDAKVKKLVLMTFREWAKAKGAK